MGLFDRSALPERLLDPATWKGTDDDVWYLRWRIHVKHWFAFSFRSQQGITATFVFFPLLYVLPFSIWFTGWSWWYFWPIWILPVFRKWRETPKVIWAWKSGGCWRWEHKGDLEDTWTWNRNPRTYQVPESGYYLSRIQPWARASLILFWPFCIAAAFFPNRFHAGIPGIAPAKQGAEIFFYRGYHFDDDLVFWGDGSGGPNFK